MKTAIFPLFLLSISAFVLSIAAMSSSDNGIDRTLDLLTLINKQTEVMTTITNTDQTQNEVIKMLNDRIGSLENTKNIATKFTYPALGEPCDPVKHNGGYTTEFCTGATGEVGSYSCDEKTRVMVRKVYKCSSFMKKEKL